MDESWEYGFYDSGTGPTSIWWYCFGLPFKNQEQARRTGEKNVYGEAVMVRRLPGMEAWERVPESPISGSSDE